MVTASPSESMLSDDPFLPSDREEVKDKYLNRDLESHTFANKLFIRLIAKDRKFTKVKFTYSIFDACYLRKCKFDSCDFTGCRFVNSNLIGATFDGCIFDYSTFEKTQIDDSILDTNCPSHENQRMRFARALRVNYQQLGDTHGANKAIAVELGAEKEFLRKAWNSPASYYRSKYRGWGRFGMFVRWLKFCSLDLVWGNGESLAKLIVAAMAVLAVLFGIDLSHSVRTGGVIDVWASLLTAPAVFLGSVSPAYYSPFQLSAIVFTRLVLIGFFMSIIIKRFNRR